MEQKICIYCKKNRADTVNYIPPQDVLLRPELHPSMLAVPCCKACKESFIRDNYYFLVFLEFIASVIGHRCSDAIMEKLSGFQMDSEARDFLDYIRRSSGQKERRIVLSSGLFPFDQPGFFIDRTRVRSVAERIVKSLIFQNIGMLSNDLISGLTTTTDYHALALDNAVNVREMFECLKSAETAVLGEERILQYRSAYAENNPSLSTWVLSFFDTFNVFAVARHEKKTNLLYL